MPFLPDLGNRMRDANAFTPKHPDLGIRRSAIPNIIAMVVAVGGGVALTLSNVLFSTRSERNHKGKSPRR